jgi:NhaP-type Na+/H+ or K+/H+ antiporter
VPLFAADQTSAAALCAAAGLLLAWALVSGRLKHWNVSSAMFFIATGAVVSSPALGILEIHPSNALIRDIAELTLALVLFSDASKVRFRLLRQDWRVPARLLGFGFPLTMALGGVVGLLLFHGRSGWLVLLVAVIVSPTDAALGAAVVEDHRVPLRLRRAINVESGLNDGLATPVFTLVLAKVAIDLGESRHSILRELLGGVALGILLGAVIGGLGGLLVARGLRHGWFADAAGGPVAVLALALTAYGAALAAGANGFVAAFCGGLAFAARFDVDRQEGGSDVIDLSSVTGGVLSAVVWMLFGAILLSSIGDASWQTVVYALLSLTVVRMLPVALGLLGTGLDRPAVCFIGWFGPRGLASIVFALLAYDDLSHGDGSFVLTTVVMVVLFSVVAHGVSANPLVARLARREPAAAGP